MNSLFSKAGGWLAFAFALLLALLAYLPGLGGPLLLDDGPNLQPIFDWASGHVVDHPLESERKAGPLGRPVSLLTFMANALTTGDAVWPIKLINVLLHLATAAVLFALLLRLFRRDEALRSHSVVLALFAACLWLLLAQHIVTVLYAVQRMTILAALFSLLGLWAYVAARERMEANDEAGALWRLALMLTAVAIAVFAKESALVFPLLLLVVEWAYFQPRSGRRSRLAWLSILAFGVLPVLAVVVWLALNPGFVLGGYANRDFTLAERALSQPRILWDYLFSTFLPMPGSASVFTDDYPVSRGLLDPPWTLIAIIGWLLLIFATVWRWRSRRSVVAGLAFFLFAHALESSIFPLEMYFTHRNYLPSVGLVVALVAGIHQLLWSARSRVTRPGLVSLSALALLGVLAASTAARAHLWGSAPRLHLHAQEHHPGSMRLHTDLLRVGIEARRLDVVQHQLSTLYSLAPASERRTVHLWNLLSHCLLGQPVSSAALDDAAREPGTRVTNYARIALQQLLGAVRSGQCSELDRARLGGIVAGWVEHSPQSRRHYNVWQARAVAGTLYAEAGEMDMAFNLVRQAWVDSGYRFDLGVLVFQLAASGSSADRLPEVLGELEQRLDRSNSHQVDTLRQLREAARSSDPDQ